MRNLLKAIALSVIPLIVFLFDIQSWEGDIIRSGALQVLLIFCMLLSFSWIFLKQSKLNSGQVVTYPFKIFSISVLFFVLFSLLLSLISGVDGLAKQLPRIITNVLLYSIKGIVPTLAVAIINYVLHAKKMRLNK